MLKLSRSQRTAIFALEPPRIEGKGTCPVKPGHWQPLSSKVSIEVRAIRRHKGGGWSLQYTIHDRRDPVRLMRRTPGIHDEGFADIRASFDDMGYPGEPTAEAIKRAAEESAYTSAPTSLSDGGEGAPADFLRAETKRARANASDRRNASELAAFRREAGELRAALARLRGLTSIDVSSDIRVMERRLQAIEQKLMSRAA